MKLYGVAKKNIGTLPPSNNRVNSYAVAQTTSFRSHHSQDKKKMCFELYSFNLS